MNKRFTVIVPIYNVRDYMENCIDSILAQTYDNFECILVDDGATDGSGEIADKYAESDDRVKVIHKQNGGLSSARNAGLQASEGQWIVHVDSDDYIEQNTLQLLDDYIRDNDSVEIIRYEYFTEYPDGKAIKHFIDRENYYGTIDKKIGIEHVVNGCSFIVTGAYKAEVSKNIAFREEIRRGADTVYALEITDMVDNILVIPDPLYHYVQRMGSLARSKITRKQLTVLDSSKFTYDFISSKYPEYLSCVLDSYVNTRVSLYYNMYTSKYEDETFKIEMIKDTHQKYIELKCGFKLSAKKRIKYALFDFNPNMYCKVFEFVINLIPGEKYAMYKTR